MVALAAIAAGQVYPFLDPVGGCLVSLLIIKVGYEAGRAACLEIVDRGLDPEILDSVRQGAERGLVQGLKETGETGLTVAGVRGTKSGAYFIIDVELEGPGTFTLDRFEMIKGALVGGVKEGVKGVKIVRLSIKARNKE